MENTGSDLFKNDKAQWYLAAGEKWIGPLTASDIYERVSNNEINWAHYVWRSGQSDWKRLCDIPIFKATLPTAPKKVVLKEVKASIKPVVKKGGKNAPPPPQDQVRTLKEERVWFLFYNDSQYGPFSTDEIRRYLKVGKISAKVHTWREGMTDWLRLREVEEFKSEKGPAAKTAQPQIMENRQAPRRPLVARIMMANQDSVIVGMCRDVSVGGMQVLTDRVPGKTGERIKLNVSPTDGTQFEPFVAHGVIVRILEDQRGFSFRFEELPGNARKIIEDYVTAT